VLEGAKRLLPSALKQRGNCALKQLAEIKEV